PSPSPVDAVAIPSPRGQTDHGKLEREVALAGYLTADAALRLGWRAQGDGDSAGRRRPGPDDGAPSLHVADGHQQLATGGRCPADENERQPASDGGGADATGAIPEDRS